METRENFSKKRMAILNVLRSTKVHPTADWVYAQLKPRCPDLSLGTVYRNLKLFCETGKAISVGVIDGKERFDGCVEPHAHLVCDVCGSVVDVHRDFFDEDSLGQLSQQTGCRMRSASVTFRGVCPRCAAEQKA